MQAQSDQLAGGVQQIAEELRQLVEHWRQVSKSSAVSAPEVSVSSAKIHTAGWMIEWVARDVRYWHKPDIAIALNHVRYWG